MDRRLLVADGEVDTGELAEVSTRSFVIGSGGCFFGAEPSQVYQLEIDADSRSPNHADPSLFVSVHAFVLRCAARSLSRVVRVLRVSRFTQILTSIIETVSVLVIDSIRCARVQKPTVEASLHTVLFSYRIPSPCLRIPIEVPPKLHHPVGVLNVDLRESSLRERHEEHAGLDVGLSPTLLRFGGANSAPGAATVPHGRLHARAVTARSASFATLFAADDTQMYNAHRSVSLHELGPGPGRLRDAGLLFRNHHHVTASLTGRAQQERAVRHASKIEEFEEQVG